MFVRYVKLKYWKMGHDDDDDDDDDKLPVSVELSTRLPIGFVVFDDIS